MRSTCCIYNASGDVLISMTFREKCQSIRKKKNKDKEIIKWSLKSEKADKKSYNIINRL